MKNLMIVALISMSIMACKNDEKKDDNIDEITIEGKTTETMDITVNNLELGCYQYKTEDNDLKMEVTKIEGDAVSANLFYAYAEKDKNKGTFFGNLHGDKLIGKYTFMSEGVESVRDVAFKIEKDQIIEGFGEMNKEGTSFKDIKNITYSSKTPWMKMDCN